MNRTQERSASVPGHRRRATSFMELLLVLAILSMLFALVLPALSSARHSANVAKCVSNLREIAATAIMYSDDNGGGLDGGNGPTMPWHLGFDYGPWSCNLVSEFVYGGFQTTIEDPTWPGADYHVYPTEVRPFNKYIAPGRHGGPLKNYICPSDTGPMWSPPGMPGPEPSPPRSGYTTWEIHGNSYPINWYWYEDDRFDGCRDYGDFQARGISFYGSQVLGANVGGAASKFVLFMESPMINYMLDARPPGDPDPSPLQRLELGWHRKFSTYSMAMWDGHAEYRFVDTRYCRGPGYSIWPDPAMPVGCEGE